MTTIERAINDYYPGQTATYSKGRSQLPYNAPDYAVSGRGAHVEGSDGRTYTDWTAALGAILLGYRDPDVDVAVRKQTYRGSLFGLPTSLEHEVAAELLALLPWERGALKYGKNGSDATSAAVRAARAITGRDYIISQGYHGFQDWSVPNKNGVPVGVQRLTHEWTPITSLKDWIPTDDFAAVIVEPDAVGKIGLEYLRGWTSGCGSLLIFDEVLTNFRIPGVFAAKHYGVTPDMICGGKAIANGLPLSFVAGREDLMRVFAGGIGYSFTFGGETLALAAAQAVIRKVTTEPVIDKLWTVGTLLQDHWNSEATRLNLDIPCVGIPSRSLIRYPSMEAKTVVLESMWAQGEMFTVGFTPNFSHSAADVHAARLAVTVALENLANGTAPHGPVVGEVYRR